MQATTDAWRPGEEIGWWVTIRRRQPSHDVTLVLTYLKTLEYKFWGHVAFFAPESYSGDTTTS
jgi:hypothetical protein